MNSLKSILGSALLNFVNHTQNRVNNDSGNTTPPQPKVVTYGDSGTCDSCDKQEDSYPGAVYEKDNYYNPDFRPDPEPTYQKPQPAIPSAGELISQSYYESTQAEYAASSNISITTQEGDEITIDIEQLEAFAKEVFFSGNAEGYLAEGSVAALSEKSLDISVKGDLNKDELKSIHALLNDVAKVSKSFFKGDTDKALRQALKIDFDAETLQSFSVDLNRSQTVKQVKAYEEIRSINPSELVDAGDSAVPSVASGEATENQSQQALTGISQLLSLLDNPILDKFESARETVKDLFTLSAEKIAESTKELTGHIEDVVAPVHDLVDKLLDQEPDNDDDKNES